MGSKSRGLAVTFDEYQSGRLRLKAYLAVPITGLPEEQARYWWEAGRKIADVASRSGVSVYLPHEHTRPGISSSMSPAEVGRLNGSEVLTSDLLIVLYTSPSSGVGAEIDIASDACIPIMLFALEGLKVSRMTPGTHGRVEVLTTFRDENDLLSSFSAEIERTKLTALRLRLKKGAGRAPGFPSRLRLMRESRGVTAAMLASEIGVSEWFVTDLETRPLSETNPTYITIAAIAQYFGIDAVALLQPACASPTLDTDVLKWMFEVFEERDLTVARLGKFYEAYNDMEFRGNPPTSKSELERLLDIWIKSQLN